MIQSGTKYALAIDLTIYRGINRNGANRSAQQVSYCKLNQKAPMIYAKEQVGPMQYTEFKF